MNRSQLWGGTDTIAKKTSITDSTKNNGVDERGDIDHFLLEKYGPLMRLAEVAKLLRRAPGGLRVAMHSDGEVSKLLRPAMTKIGRTVYFRTLQVKEALGLDHGSDT